MTPKASAKDPAVTVRFPHGSNLLERLDQAAGANGRSRNTEIIARLLDSFAARDARRKRPAR